MGAQVVCETCGSSYDSGLPLEVAVNPVRCLRCGAKAVVRPVLRADAPVPAAASRPRAAA